MNRLRRILILVLGIALLFVMMVPAGTTMAAAKNPFVGAWNSTDVDGSHQRLTIGGGNHRFNWHDDGGSVCGEFDAEGNPTIPALYRGKGTRLDDDTMELEGGVWCLYRDARGRTLVFDSLVVFLDHNPATDTLEGGGVVWYRAGA